MFDMCFALFVARVSHKEFLDIELFAHVSIFYCIYCLCIVLGCWITCGEIVVAGVGRGKLLSFSTGCLMLLFRHSVGGPGAK